MSEIVREIIDCLCTEEMDWEAIAEHYELCRSCGGIPTGSYVSNTPFIECESHNCDVAFELMCDDFIDETGNGNSTRNLMSQLYDCMKEHNDLEAFATTEREWLEENDISTKDMMQEDLIWSRLNGFDRQMLNERIVEYWKQDREVVNE
ncbi:MAG: hypothetical protein HOC79_05650 [Euryarchaeota archaeon]|jgi:hypothetical protein|nr:hypothetical protein [Euryarchaeota archaeon]